MGHANIKRLILLPLLAAAVFAAGILLGKYQSYRNFRAWRGEIARGDSPPADDKLGQVLRLIHGSYVDEPQMDSIEETVIPMILQSLDPHSDYIPAEEMEGVNETIEGQFDGIGVMFNMADDTVRISNVIAGGPSARAGLLAGDRILTAGGDTVSGARMPQDSVVRRLRGPRGTKVMLGIERRGAPELLPVEITRGVIPLKSVDAGMMIDGRTGYIQLTVFARNSHSEIVRLVEEMKAAGMKNLILDLRGNTGGLLDQAIRIANEFLPEGAMIVYTEGRANPRLEQRADGRGRLQDITPVILIDEGSASASEIVAGALQDNDRGTIVGRRSFGKGLVQEQIPMDDGSAVRLTVSRYYTPVGRSIQKPYDEGTEAYYQEMQQRFDHSELFSADSIRFADSLRFTTPGGRTVYGGGGIMPDIFVPIDTTRRYDRFAERVLVRNILFEYTIQYTDEHRAELNAITSLDSLSAYFDRDTSLYDRFVDYAAARGERPQGDQKENSRELLTTYLRAYIGRNTPLEENAYYYYQLPVVDDVFRRTMQFLQKEEE